MATVAIVLGSGSDKDVVRDSGMLEILQAVFSEPGVSDLTFEMSICSAHRNLPELQAYVQKACQDGTKVFIGVAGMAAALPGALASCTGMAKPIIAVPLDGHGVDSCLYMPPGVPVLTTGVGKAGLKNAALAACQILAVDDHDMELALLHYISQNNKQPEFRVNL